MTQEEKAKRYSEALERAKKLQETCDSTAVVGWCEYIFPELKISEAERIRGAIIDHLKDNNLTEWADWLEKQGVQKSLDDVTKEVTKNKETAMSFLKSCGIMNANGELADEYKIEQGGQNPNPYSGMSFEYNGHTWGMCARDNGVEIGLDGELKAFLSLEKSFIYPIHSRPSLISKSAQEIINKEKDEPKFKVGDWITNGRYVKLIVGINSDWPYYMFKDGTSKRIKDIDKKYHLWTIQDAKDGDVLCLYYNNRKTFFIFKAIIGEGDYADILVHCCYTGKYQYLEPSFNEECRMHQISDGGYCLPADKEEQGILFQKMKEAGYECDSKIN